MSEYNFDSAEHIYRIDGQIVPSVTQILPSRDYSRFEWQRTKGSYVHDMVKLYLANDLDEDTLDQQLVPYLEAYKAAEKLNFDGLWDLKSGCKSVTVELQLATYVMLANEGVKTDGTRPGQIEIEEPLFHPVLRLAGTPDLIITNHYPIRHCAALYLKPDGTYKFEDHSNDLRQNIRIAQCYLTTYHDRKKRGV